MRGYLHRLEPKHSPPYPLERTRILEVALDVAMDELVNIVRERRQATPGMGFISLTIDFWTDQHRRQQFGCAMLDLIAKRYHMSDGNCLFMSDATRNEIGDDRFNSRKYLICIHFVPTHTSSDILFCLA